MLKWGQAYSKPHGYHELILRKHRRYLACAISTVQAVSRAPGVYQLASTISQCTARTGHAVKIKCDPCACLLRDLGSSLLESVQAGLFDKIRSIEIIRVLHTSTGYALYTSPSRPPFDQNQPPTSLKPPPSPHRLFDLRDSLDKLMHFLPQLSDFVPLRNGFYGFRAQTA